VSLPGLPVDFEETPRRCPVCGGTRWRDVTKRGWEIACVTCYEQEHGREPIHWDPDHEPEAPL
jgi:hypothetical protein